MCEPSENSERGAHHNILEQKVKSSLPTATKYSVYHHASQRKTTHSESMKALHLWHFLVWKNDLTMNHVSKRQRIHFLFVAALVGNYCFLCVFQPQFKSWVETKKRNFAWRLLEKSSWCFKYLVAVHEWWCVKEICQLCVCAEEVSVVWVWLIGSAVKQETHCSDCFIWWESVEVRQKRNIILLISNRRHDDDDDDDDFFISRLKASRRRWQWLEVNNGAAVNITWRIVSAAQSAESLYG